MGFLNPIFLLGALAAGVPILVHLVRKTRATHLPFPSLMFLRRIEQKTVRKRKLRNLLLLALRSLALLLLALAFARPYFHASGSSEAASADSKLVVLLDTSYSMRYPGVFDRAKDAARDVFRKAAPGARIGLASFSNDYQVVHRVESGGDPSGLLEQIQPGVGSTDYFQAVQAGDSLLRQAGGPGGKIYLISDFHQPGWDRNTQPPKLSPGTSLVPVNVGTEDESNLAVTAVTGEPIVYEGKYSGKLIATLASYQSATAANAQPVSATVNLKINDLVDEKLQVQLTPGVPQPVEFSGFNLAEGPNRVTIEVEGDTFPIDNSYSFAIRRQSKTKVLAIETATRGRSSSFYLRQSMLAGTDSPYDLTVTTAGSTNPADLQQYRVIVLNDPADISEALATALKEFAEKGGGLLIGAGQHISFNNFNRQLGPILPAKLGDAVQLKTGYALLSQVKVDDPIFKVFKQAGQLAPTRVYAYHSAEPTDKGTVVANLDDGSPLIAEGQPGHGKVILVTTSLDNSWTDLPVTPLYLPIVREMLDYLSGKSNPTQYTVGQSFPVEANGGVTAPEVQAPDGTRVDLATGPGGTLKAAGSQAGFYRISYGNNTDYIAVNLDTKESDFARLNPNELVAAITNSPGSPVIADNQGSTPDQIEARQKVWLPLLLLALLLFGIEAILAGRIRVPKIIG